MGKETIKLTRKIQLQVNAPTKEEKKEGWNGERNTVECKFGKITIWTECKLEKSKAVIIR